MRKPIFWLLLGAASILAASFTAVYFPKAFPIVHLDLTTSRADALAVARAAADRSGWGPAKYRQTAVFDSNEALRDYIELEAGGSDAFGRLLESKLYHPYAWSVRHFREGVETEATVTVTPSGRPDGFRLVVPETEHGTSVTSERARKIAEDNARRHWGVAFDDYALIERSRQVRISGRVDHAFVYERRSFPFGDAKLRLRLAVSGDVPSEVNYFVKIPEAFSRRYEEMRSANETLSSAATIAVGVLYVLGGSLVGIVLLSRQRRAVWRIPLIAAGSIAVLQLLGGINSWPLQWMGYDTAVSFGGYYLENIIGLIYKFLFDFVVLALTFTAAESLSRKAFPGHIQMTRIWSNEAACSRQVAGRSLAGYFLVPVFAAYQVALYLLYRKIPGWWTPSEMLFDPNIFASYLPWFSSFSTALYAGVWEECLFRAVPLASAALIGERFGNRKAWILGVLLLQAAVFGAAHANYPNQPPYARLVELMLPSVGFGLLYLYFGLLPAIILHFSFDAVWMSLPLFISSAPGILVERFFAVASGLFPLLVVGAALLRRRSVGDLPADYYNDAWTPPQHPAVHPAAEKNERPAGLTLRSRKLFLASGLAGVLLWVSFARFSADMPSMAVTRSTAEKAAREALAGRGTGPGAPWTVLSTVAADIASEERFVWQEGGREAFHRLLTAFFLDPPLWVVRFARFEGDVAQRAEEYLVAVTGGGAVAGVTHKLPENAPGKRLAEGEARSVALAAIREKYGTSDGLVEITASPSRLPHRTDWGFTYSDPSRYPLSDGQARVTAAVAGGEVAGIHRWVYVPEQWRRQERNRQSVTGIVEALAGITVIALFVFGTGAALLNWTKKRFSPATFIAFSAVMLVLLAVGAFNAWPDVTFHFSTAAPLRHQVLSTIGFSLLGVLFGSLSIAAMNGFLSPWGKRGETGSAARDILPALSLALLLSGTLALAARLLPQPVPLIPDVEYAGSRLPFLALVTDALVSYIRQTTIFLLIFVGMERLSGWRAGKALYPVSFVLGLALAGSSRVESLPLWAANGIVIGNWLYAGFRYVFRSRFSLVPVATAGLSCLALAQQGIFRPFPLALPGSVFAAILVSLSAWLWMRAMER